MRRGSEVDKIMSRDYRWIVRGHKLNFKHLQFYTHWQVNDTVESSSLLKRTMTMNDDMLCNHDKVMAVRKQNASAMWMLAHCRYFGVIASSWKLVVLFQHWCWTLAAQCCNLRAGYLGHQLFIHIRLFLGLICQYGNTSLIGTPDGLELRTGETFWALDPDGILSEEHH